MSRLINNEAVQSPTQLEALLNALDTEVDALRTLANELRTDHATFKTLADELIADHATFILAVSRLKVALKNICLSDGGCAIGSTKQKIKTAANVTFLINGTFYTKTATDDLWTLTGFNCTNAKYNKCLLCLDSSGNPQVAPGTEGDSAAAVVLPTIPASYAVIGMVQVHPTGTGNFAGTTTALDDGTVVPNATYTDLAFHPDTVTDAPATLSAASPATLAAAAVTEQVTKGK